MTRKVCRQMLIALAIFCATPLTTVLGQAGPGRGYAKIPKGAYSIIAEIHAKPGKRENLRAATLPLIHLVRSDPKNLVYFFPEDRENPGRFVFYEVFATKEDFEAHNKHVLRKGMVCQAAGTRRRRR